MNKFVEEVAVSVQVYIMSELVNLLFSEGFGNNCVKDSEVRN